MVGWDQKLIINFEAKEIEIRVKTYSISIVGGGDENNDLIKANSEIIIPKNEDLEKFPPVGTKFSIKSSAHPTLYKSCILEICENIENDDIGDECVFYKEEKIEDEILIKLEGYVILNETLEKFING